MYYLLTIITYLQLSFQVISKISRSVNSLLAARPWFTSP